MPRAVLLVAAVLLTVASAACGRAPAVTSDDASPGPADDASVAAEHADAGADILVGDAPATCLYHQVVRTYIETEFCTGYVSDPSLCVPYQEAYRDAADGVVLAVEERWFPDDAPPGSDAYVVRETYHLVTFVKPAGTSLIAMVDAACRFGAMTYPNGGPTTYPWVSSAEALEILAASLGEVPELTAPRLVWYPAPECGYPLFVPCWYLEAVGDPATHWFVNQLGEVYSTVARPLMGGG